MLKRSLARLNPFARTLPSLHLSFTAYKRDHSGHSLRCVLGNGAAPVRVFSSKKIPSIWTQEAVLQSQSNIESLAPGNHPWIELLGPGPPTLPPEERVLTFLSASIGAGQLHGVARDWKHLPTTMHSAGLEVALQSHLFAGYARAINALATIHRVGVCRGDGDAVAAWRMEDYSLDKWHSDGETTCKEIYGRAYDKLRKRMNDMHPVLDRMMIENGYGRVLARPGLSLRLRELCVIAILAGQDVAPQLNSHIRGAIRVGATKEEVLAVLEQTSLVWGHDAQLQAIATFETVENARYGL